MSPRRTAASALVLIPFRFIHLVNQGFVTAGNPGSFRPACMHASYPSTASQTQGLSLRSMSIRQFFKVCGDMEKAAAIAPSVTRPALLHHSKKWRLVLSLSDVSIAPQPQAAPPVRLAWTCTTIARLSQRPLSERKTRATGRHKKYESSVPDASMTGDPNPRQQIFKDSITDHGVVLAHTIESPRFGHS